MRLKSLPEVSIAAGAAGVSTLGSPLYCGAQLPISRGEEDTSGEEAAAGVVRIIGGCLKGWDGEEGALLFEADVIDGPDGTVVATGGVHNGAAAAKEAAAAIEEAAGLVDNKVDWCDVAAALESKDCACAA